MDVSDKSPMTVWVMESGEYDGCRVDGVFSTPLAAWQWLQVRWSGYDVAWSANFDIYQTFQPGFPSLHDGDRSITGESVAVFGIYNPKQEFTLTEWAIYDSDTGVS